MSRHLRALRSAYDLWRSPERSETIVAVAIVAVALGPAVYRWVIDE